VSAGGHGMTLRLDKVDLALLAVIVVSLLVRQFGIPLPDILPDDAPIPVTEAKVLILYETAERHRLTPGQLDVIDDVTAAGELNKYLRDKVGTGNFRAYDKDTDVSHSEPWVKEAVAYYGQHGGGVVPWLLVATPRGGYAGPVPDGVDA